MTDHASQTIEQLQAENTNLRAELNATRTTLEIASKLVWKLQDRYDHHYAALVEWVTIWNRAITCHDFDKSIRIISDYLVNCGWHYDDLDWPNANGDRELFRENAMGAQARAILAQLGRDEQEQKP